MESGRVDGKWTQGLKLCANPTTSLIPHFTMNPNTTNNVLGFLLLRSRDNNTAYRAENEQLRAQNEFLASQRAEFQDRIHMLHQWNRELVNNSLDEADRMRTMQQGARIVIENLDAMYNLFTDMANEHPDLQRYHEDVSRIVLSAEVGRTLIAPEIIDLTAEDTEEEEEVEL